MLKPIPARIMQSTATVKACVSVDKYQNQTFTTYTVHHVHIQPATTILKTVSDTNTSAAVGSQATLFVDRKHSTPNLDWWGLFNTAHAVGGDVKVTIRGQEYTVLTVEELRDDTDQFHHYEIGLGV